MSEPAPARIDPEGEALVAALQADRSWHVACVVGPTDAGKTTLCRLLGWRLGGELATLAVDADPGQSSLGPPACVALAREPWDGGPPLALRFVGSTSPAGHFLQALSGIKRLVERALAEGARRVVVDSSGYMGDPAGAEYHYRVLDLLAPDHVVVLQRRDEMEPLLAALGGRARACLHRVPVSAAVRRRPLEARRAYRQRRFAGYFRSAGPLTVGLRRLGRHGMLPPSLHEARDCLVALCDDHGFAAALGIVQAADEGREEMQLWCPPVDLTRVASVQFSRLRLDPSGRPV
ncbi:MAG: polynucleotide 5'-hydroxyl-kinase [Candidatus Latescibacterota bacterium]